jgi:hypothetical protein
MDRMLSDMMAASRYVSRSLASPVNLDSSGWVWAGETWTYASASTFTVSGDVTAKYGVGDKLQLKQGGSYLYFWVTAVSYSAPNTTITVAGASTETLANATITDNYYSKANTPQGWPFRPPLFPKRATMWHDWALATTGNAIAAVNISTQNYALASYQNPPANGDTFTHGCLLAAGTYTLKILGITDPSYGKIDWYLDGVSIATGQDWYSAGALVKNVVKTVANVSVVGSGWHILRGTVNGKNGTSTNYYIALTKYDFIPSAD